MGRLIPRPHYLENPIKFRNKYVKALADSFLFYPVE
jgi:hypothetical protein